MKNGASLGSNTFLSQVKHQNPNGCGFVMKIGLNWHPGAVALQIQYGGCTNKVGKQRTCRLSPG